MKIQVRQARANDAAQFANVIRESITFLCTADHQNDSETLDNWLANKTSENFYQAIQNPQNSSWVATDDEDFIVGVALMSIASDALHTELHLLYVRPGYERSGVGSRLLKAIEQRAAQLGKTSIRLQSTKTGREFYETNGYVHNGEPIAVFGLVKGFPYQKPAAV